MPVSTLGVIVLVILIRLYIENENDGNYYYDLSK